MLLLSLFACLHSAPGGAMKIQGSFAVSLEAGEGTEVAFTVENVGDDRGTFCTYHTPIEGIRNDIFVVDRDGTEVPYDGILAKRSEPDADDYRTLDPGQSTPPATVDLGGSYKLTPGTYTVRFRGSSISGLPDSEPATMVVP